MTALLTGFVLGLSLILAIGAQNAFVLRQGVRREHVFAICLACGLSDAVLLFFGVSGFGQLLHYVPWLDPVMRYGGALFLFWYGFKSLWSAFFNRDSLMVEGEASHSLPDVLCTCLALTWLNPHVYLDTLVMMGSLSTRFNGAEYLFATGATTASFVFFFGLGYGARYLRPLFSRPIAWTLLDTVIGIMMWGIGLSLLVGRQG